MYATDLSLNRYRNFSVTDIDLWENGVLKNPTMSMNCDTSNQPIPVAVCLTLDQSFSMSNKTPANDTYWDWVRYGAKVFVDSIDLVPPSCVAITSFGGNSYVRAGFQTVKPPLYTALDNIPIQGGTNYDEAFLDLSSPNGAAGAIAVMRGAPRMLRRFIVILTDGQPDKPPTKQRIIDSCLANNITVFAINIYTPKSQNINADLADICNKTGGRAYLAHSKAELGNIYNLIAQEIQRNIDCRISWTTTPGCTQNSRNRALRATLKKSTPTITWNGSYFASAYSVADPIPSVSTLSFDDPGTGNVSTKTFQITAPAKLSIRVDGFTASLAQRFKVLSTSKSLPATLQPGETMDVVVEFNQTTTGATHSGTLAINGSPCSNSIIVNVIIPILKLQTPVGGESLNGCDTIPIKWSGVAEDEAISIMYSSNNGTKWNLLTSQGTGFVYNWFHRVEHDFGTDNLLAYKVKVQRSSCRFVSSFGGAADDSAKGLCLNSFSKDLGVGGSFLQGMRFANATLSGFGKRDGYFGVLNQNGIQKWSMAFGGSENDEIAAVDADAQGNWIVAGNSKSATISCGDSTIVIARPLTQCGFVACIDTLGKTRWCVAIGDSSGLNLGELIISSVRANTDSSVTVQGLHRGVISSIYTKGSTFSTTSFDGPNLVGMWFPISIDITKTGRVRRFLEGYTVPSQVEAARSVVTATQAYECGSFSGSIKCGQSTNGTNGNSDGFVRGVTLNTGSDQSAKSFSILTALSMFEAYAIDMGPVDVGKSFLYPVGQPFRNDGTRNLNVTSIFTCGIDSADFLVERPSAPSVIGAHTNPDIHIRVTPRAIAHIKRSAYMVVLSECNDPAFIRLTSAANFANLSMTGTDFHRRRIGSINYDTMKILNDDPGAIPVKSLSESFNQWSQFSWTSRMPSDSVIKSKTEVPIIVRFIPTHIEVDSLEVRIDTSQAIHVPLTAHALGAGFLPRCSSSGYSYYAIQKGKVSPEAGSVIIRNIDTIAALRIYSSHWRNAQSDDFHALRTLPDTSIAPGDSVVIPVQYYPLSTGAHTAFFVFEHDAAPGPDPLPRAFDTVALRGDAYELVVDSTRLRFPTLLSCDSAGVDFTITNHSSATDIRILGLDLQQNLSSFTVSPSAPFVVKAGTSQVIHVSYNPTGVGLSTAKLIVQPDSSLAADTLLLSGESITAQLSIVATDSTLTVDIGKSYTVKVLGSLKSSTPFILDTISFAFHTNPSQARFAVERFMKNAYGWIWKVDSISSTYLFSGNYTGTSLTNPIHFMDLPLDVYLSQNFNNTMSIITKADNVQECLIVDSAHVSMIESEVCYTRGSQVIYAKALSLQVSQRNEAELRIDYSLANAGPVVLELYSSRGDLIKSVELDHSHSGQFSTTMSVAGYSPGLYFCRIRAYGQQAVNSFIHD